MEAIQFQLCIFPALLSLFLLWSITKWLYKPPGKKNLPPSPPRLPILGNLHQLGPLPHRNLQWMAQKHGPLMLLHFGSVPVLIVSSADAAREIMRTHDVTFSNRPLYKILKKVLYNGKDVVFGSYGEYWRQMKSMFVLQLLSSKRVESFRSIREDETALFVKKIGESSGPVNLSKMFSVFTNDGVCRSAFGRKYSESENGNKLIEIAEEISEMLGAFCIGDFIPWLSWIDRITGVDEKANRVAKEMDDFLEGVIQERLETETKESCQDKNGENFLDIMLKIYSDQDGDVAFDRESIKASLWDVFAAGTDTSSIVLEWTMAELLRHPNVMRNLQEEVRDIVKEKRDINEDDLGKMHYLKAVIKESLRLHPPAPLLVPRVASKDVIIKGHNVSAGTMVMINAWSIARDPTSWYEQEKFEPERFLNSSKDFKGLDFDFIPFGAGRRGCPGMGFAIATIEVLLANLVHKFEWQLPNGAKVEDLDMREKTGIAVHRCVPLLAAASKSDFMM